MARMNNKVKECMRAGRKAHGFMTSFNCPEMLEIMGHLGFDFVTIDAEHGAFTPESAEESFRAADAVGMTSLVRVPDHEASTILRFMDRGAYGIMAPHVSTRPQAERLVKAVKYAPIGKRGLGTVRAGTFGAIMSFSEYAAWANNESLIMIQLEDVQAQRNLDEILKVDGIDLFTFGPADLSQSMGLPGQTDHPRVRAALTQMSDKIRASGKLLASDVMSNFPLTNVLINAAKEFMDQAHGRG